MFADLSDSISRRGKIIIAIWIVAVLILIPPAVRSMDSLGYDMSDLGGLESSDADRKMSAYFDEADIDQTRIPLILVSYGSRDGYRQLQGDEESGIPSYTDYLRTRFLTDKDWLKKLDVSDGLVGIRTYGGPSEGAILLGLVYNQFQSDSDIASDTGALRDSVSQFTDDFIYELYEEEALFDVYVTGNNAVVEDLSSETVATAIFAAAVVIILTLILTGLFFGSAVTTLIVAASIVPPSVLTMAAMFGLGSMIGVSFISGILVLIGVLAMSFVHCIYMISVYRSELMSCRDRSTALKETVRITGRPILSTSICLLVCTITLFLFGDGVFAAFGACMSAGTALVMLSSLTVPASLMNITRNELFWSVDPDRGLKPAFIRRINDRAEDGFGDIMGSISRITSNHGKAVLIVSLCLVACGAGYLADTDMNGDTRYDMSESMATGESKMGLDILKDNSDGGILHPLRIIAGFDSPVGDIVYDRERGLNRLDWRTDDAASQMGSLAASISDSDRDNISRTTTVMTWTSLRGDYDPSEDDPRTVVSDVSNHLGSIDGTYGIAFDRIILKLLAAGFTYQEIAESCGPYIDYGLNESLGLIGYEMLSDRSIVVTHLRVDAFTCESPMSIRSIQTIETVEGVVDSVDFATVSIGGAGVFYKEFMDSTESGFWNAILFVIAALLIVLAVCLSLGTSVRAIATTVSGAVVSLAVTEYAVLRIWGNVSVTVQVAMLIVCIMIGIWFNAIQENRITLCRKHGMNWREASAEMLTTLQPVVVTTSIVLSASFLALCVSGIQMIGQLGFTVAVAILIDAFFVRTFMSPSIWSIRWKGSRRE